MFKFVPTKYGNKLCEISQNMITRFAYVKKQDDGTYTNAHDFVMCRDFLGDALVALKTKTLKAIYGFSFNGKNQTFLTDSFKLIVRYPDAQTLNNTLKNLSRLHELEAKVGRIKKTTITQIDDSDCEYTVLVDGSKFWFKSVFNVSLYTFLVKCLGYKLDPGVDFMEAVSKTKYTYTAWDGSELTHKTVESDYATAVGHKVLKVLPKLHTVHKDLTTLHGYPKKVNISTLHDQSGFKSLLTVTNWSTKNKIHDRLQEVLNAM